MSDLFQTLAAAASGMQAQAARLRVSTENIANADTPGYRRKTLPFEELAGADGAVVVPGRVRLDRAEPTRIHDPAHPLADAEGYVTGSNVNLMVELADAREAQRSYEANLRAFDQARQMASATIELLRR